eukprot:gene5009-253_t
MTGDSWEVEMRAAWHGAGIKGVVFICVFYMWSVWVLVNLFTAIVLDSFGEADADKYDKQKKVYEVMLRKELHRMQQKRRSSALKVWNIQQRVRQFLDLPQAIHDEKKKRAQESIDEELQDIDPYRLHAIIQGGALAE